MKNLRLVGIFLFTLASLGCEPKFDVRLASDGETLPAPRFVVIEGSDATPEFDTIRVTDTDGTMMWHAMAEVFGSSGASEFAYGTPPAGFTDAVAAAPLQTSVRYRLVVVGAERVERYFEANAERLIVMLP